MAYRVHITADFDSETAAKMAESDMEEAVVKHDGDLMWSEIEDLHDEDVP
jgi:hypothetical protein